MRPGTNAANSSHVTPPAADLSDPADGEVWLDLVAAAISGICAAGWSKDGKSLNSISSGIASRVAVEVADQTFAEYKKRRG